MEKYKHIKRVIIHVGLPKTATSSIYYTLFHNKSFIKKNTIYCLKQVTHYKLIIQDFLTVYFLNHQKFIFYIMDFFFLGLEEEALGDDNKFVKLNKLLDFSKLNKILKGIHTQDITNQGRPSYDSLMMFKLL